MHGLTSPEGLDTALQNFEGAIVMRCHDGTIKKAVEAIQKNNPKLQVEWV